MKNVTVYYVTSKAKNVHFDDRLHIATLSQPEAEKVATDVYRSESIIAEIHANERTPIDWAAKDGTRTTKARARARDLREEVKT